MAERYKGELMFSWSRIASAQFVTSSSRSACRRIRRFSCGVALAGGGTGRTTMERTPGQGEHHQDHKVAGLVGAVFQAFGD